MKQEFEFDTVLTKDEYSNVSDIDEWGTAYVSVIGTNYAVEYNFCKEDKVDYSAIYKVEYSPKDNEWHTDYSVFVEYHIDFNNLDWEKALKNRMISVAKEMFNLK